MSTLVEGDDFPSQLLRSVRQGMYFGIETRIPYAVTSIIRPMLFNKPSRPIFQSLKFYGDQTLKHGWIIARISFLFKLSEKALMKLSGSDKLEQWHSFVAGCFAGYLIMARDSADSSLKKQINMAIGIRTIFAFGSYLVRKDMIPTLSHSAEGYDKGLSIFNTLMWGVVMWHWRHQTVIAPGEMNPAQVSQMDFIYNHGDKPGLEKWFGNYYLLWAAALVGLRKM